MALKTLGCRLNQAETATMAGQFRAAGFDVVPFGRACDVCVIHGCAVTARAETRSLRFARAGSRLPGPPLVVIAGCVVEAAAPAALRASGADLAVRRRRLPDLVGLVTARTGLGSPPFPAPCPPPVPWYDTVRAWVKAQDGCDFGCAYCIVPFTRGAPVSRAFDEIIAEARRLAAAGHREIVLTGANLAGYRHGPRRLVHLLAALESIPGVSRLRLSSIEISGTEREVVDFMAQSAKLCRYLHLPLQSGDDRVLAAMGRRYTVNEYRRVVDYAGDRLGRAGLGTDILVGFPGEDGAAFENTVRVVESLPFTRLHVFPYSPRPHTRAAAFPGAAAAAERKRRADTLATLGAAKRRTFAAALVGVRVRALIERSPAGGPATGWTEEYVPLKLDGAAVPVNRIVQCVPTRVENGAVRACGGDAVLL